MAAAERIAAGVAALAAAVGGYVLFLVASSSSGDSYLDGLRWQTAIGSFLAFIPTPSTMRAMAVIFHNESTAATALDVVDLDAPGGPGVGPGKVNRGTAMQLGLWPHAELYDADDRQRYADFGSDPANQGELVRWAVRVYADKLRIAKGDVATAVRLYNGSGTDAMAYLARAQTFAQSKFGGLA